MERASLRKVDLESLFLVGATVLALWILFGSFQFPETARLYPLYTSIAVIVLAILLLFQKHALEGVQRRLGRDSDAPESSLKGDAEEGSGDEEDVNRKSVGIIALIYGGYIVALNIVGFLVSSMVMMYVVLWYYDYGNERSRLLSAVLIGVFVYGGYVILNIDLSQGIIWNWIL